jgi:hypothetical protein
MLERSTAESSVNSFPWKYYHCQDNYLDQQWARGGSAIKLWQWELYTMGELPVFCSIFEVFHCMCKAFQTGQVKIYICRIVNSNNIDQSSPTHHSQPIISFIMSILWLNVWLWWLL